MMELLILITKWQIIQNKYVNMTYFQSNSLSYKVQKNK
jgi:hypothetical protein